MADNKIAELKNAAKGNTATKTEPTKSETVAPASTETAATAATKPAVENKSTETAPAEGTKRRARRPRRSKMEQLRDAEEQARALKEGLAQSQLSELSQIIEHSFNVKIDVTQAGSIEFHDALDKLAQAANFPRNA